MGDAPALATRAAALAGGRLTAAQPLGGGDLSEVVRIDLADGRVLVAKRGSEVESAMLGAIRATGAPAPAVLAVADGIIVMGFCPRDRRLGPAWGSVGEGVRMLHAATATGYGWAEPHAFGPVAIPGGLDDHWPTFWAEKRLLPCAPHVPAPIARRIEALARRLDDLLPAHPRPALLHGDLWTGNLLVDEGRLTGLIDPACLWGHVEVDLAMLGLFGEPGAAFWARYGAREPGWQAREPLSRLWPALVHLRLFGGGYRGLVQELLAASGA